MAISSERYISRNVIVEIESTKMKISGNKKSNDWKGAINNSKIEYTNRYKEENLNVCDVSLSSLYFKIAFLLKSLSAFNWFNSEFTVNKRFFADMRWRFFKRVEEDFISSSKLIEKFKNLESILYGNWKTDLYNFEENESEYSIVATVAKFIVAAISISEEKLESKTSSCIKRGSV